MYIQYIVRFDDDACCSMAARNHNLIITVITYGNIICARFISILRQCRVNSFRIAICRGAGSPIKTELCLLFDSARRSSL